MRSGPASSATFTPCLALEADLEIPGRAAAAMDLPGDPYGWHSTKQTWGVLLWVGVVTALALAPSVPSPSYALPTENPGSSARSAFQTRCANQRPDGANELSNQSRWQSPLDTQRSPASY